MSESLGVTMWPSKIKKKAHREKDFPALANQQRSAAGFKFVSQPVCVIDKDTAPMPMLQSQPAADKTRRSAPHSRSQVLLEILHRLSEDGTLLPPMRDLGVMIDPAVPEDQRASTAQNCLLRLTELGLIRMWVGVRVNRRIDTARAVAIVSTGAVLRNKQCPAWLLP